MSEENVSKNLKTSAILESIFVTIAKVKKVNVRDLIWDANLAHFGMSEPPSEELYIVSSKSGFMIYT